MDERDTAYAFAEWALERLNDLRQMPDNKDTKGEMLVLHAGEDVVVMRLAQLTELLSEQFAKRLRKVTGNKP